MLVAKSSMIFSPSVGPWSLSWLASISCLTILTIEARSSIFLKQKHNDIVSELVPTTRFGNNLGSSWSWSYGSSIYNYLCNQCLSSLMLWVRIQLRQGVLDTTLWLATGRWFSLVSSTNKTDRHDITEILLKMALNTITLNPR